MSFVTMSHRRLLVLAAIAGVAGVSQVAGAQFTTFIPPKNKVADSVKAVVVAEQKAQADTAAAVRLTNMKTWVDSAAGALPAAPPMPARVADSLAASAPGAGVPGPDTTTFRNGSRAPATASSLPLIALLGAAIIAFGVLFLGTARPQAAVVVRDET